MSLQNASLIIAGEYTRFGRRAPAINQDETKRSPTRSDEALQELFDHIKRQEGFNHQVQQQLQEHKTYINERLEERDRKLMQTLNQLQEAKKKKSFFRSVISKMIYK